MLGLVVLALVIAVAANPEHFRLTTPGPMNLGHEDLACGDCHLPAPGEIRQQAQAALRWHLGLRERPAYLATLPVDNQACLGCHERSDDRHPVYRFTEPRFAEARAEIGADQCVSCHREHEGVRVSAAMTICRNCHQSTALDRDPVDVSHVDLIASERWETCLGCHDFHGNHPFDAPTRLDEAFSPSAIEAYLGGGEALYSSPDAKRHVAPKSRPADE